MQLFVSLKRSLIITFCMKEWWDPHLCWNSWEHYNVSKILFHTTDVWMPELTILNT